MRPVKLVVEGIRSYRAITEVDFSDLTLFALIGDTGAGKSSLIEAMCLALYGSTTWSGRNVAELMCDSAERMAVEFTFTAANDTWTVTRAHRRAGGVPIHKLTSASGQRENGADAVTRRVQKVIGLNKEQFLKAVVMPQGRFEELLKATPAHRTDLLKGIFRLQSLDAVRSQVATMTSRWREPVAELRGERGVLASDSAQAVADATEEHRVAAEHAGVLKQRADAAARAQEAADKAAQRAELLQREITAAGNELDAAAATDIGPIELAAAEIARLTVEAAQAQDEAAAKAAAAEVLATSALGGFTTRDDAVTGRGRLLRAGEAVVTQLDARDSATKELAELDAGKPPDEIDPELDRAAETTSEHHEEARSALRDAQRSLDEATLAYRHWNERRAKSAASSTALKSAAASKASAVAEAEARVGALGQAELELEEAREAQEAATRSCAAAASGAGCEPGDNCPVCARPLDAGFTPPLAPDLERATAAVRTAAAAVEHCRSAATTAGAALARAEAKAEAASNELDQAVADLEFASVELRRRVAVAVSDDLREDAAVAGLAAVVADLGREVTTTAHALSAATDVANQARRDLAATQSGWQARHAHASEAHRQACAALTRTRADLAGLPERWRPSPDAEPATLEALAEALDAALTDHATHSATAENERESHTVAARALLALRTREATSVTQPVTELVTAVNRARAAVGDLAALLETTVILPDDATARAPLSEVACAVAALQTAGRAVLDAATTQHGRDSAAARKATVEFEEVLRLSDTTTLGDLRSQAGGAEAKAGHAHKELARVIAAASRAAQIDEILVVASPFLDALDALNKLLTDGRFIGHLVREREVALLTEASRVLRRLSGDRFGFGEDFSVIDRLSGRERGPDTLSGGERFQASLALALALVEIATRGGGQLEAVFIDEGFGSLDAASLDQALVTLGAVASDGKLVALVSHLRQVAEYVDQVLLVECDDATGSRVRLLDPSERDKLLADDSRSRMTG